MSTKNTVSIVAISIAIVAIVILGIYLLKRTIPKISENVTYTVYSSNATSKAIDMHLVSTIVEEVTTSLKKSKRIGWEKIGFTSTGKVDFKCTAYYEYFVDWSKFNIRHENNYIYAEFKRLKLKTPVTYDGISAKNKQGIWVWDRDLEAYLEAYTKPSGELSILLEGKGNTENNIMIAEARGAESLKKILKDRILPMMGIKADQYDNIDIEFMEDVKDSGNRVEIK